MRRSAILIGTATVVILSACGSGQSSAPSDALAAAQAVTATIQLHIPGIPSIQAVDKIPKPGMACFGIATNSVGEEMQLQDETGVLLARTKITPGKLMDGGVDCRVDLTFANVRGNAKMYMLADTENRGWKLMPSEINPGPAVIELDNHSVPL